MRGNKRLNKFLQKNRFIYPFLVSLLVSSVMFPPGLGRYIQSGYRAALKGSSQVV